MSFKTANEIFSSPPVWFPKSLNFSNYAVLFKDGDALTVWHSLVLATISTAIATVLRSVPGARHREPTPRWTND